MAIKVHSTQVGLKNRAPFTKCIIKIDVTTIDDVEFLDFFMAMYNMIEYRIIEPTGSLWFYSNNEATDFDNNAVNTNKFKFFKDKAKLLGNPVVQPTLNQANGSLENATITVLVKYLTIFWRSLQLSVINCKVELKLRWVKNSVLSILGNENDNTNADSNNIIFTIKDTKLYVSLVTSLTEDNQKLSKFLNKVLKR